MNPEVLEWIEKQKPFLVEKAEKYIEKAQLKNNAVVSTSQIRNVLNAALSGNSVAVLVNFLQHQISRKNTRWQYRGCGEELIRVLTEEIQPLAKKGPHGRETSVSIYDLEAQISAQFLGFVLRHYAYCCAKKGTRS